MKSSTKFNKKYFKKLPVGLLLLLAAFIGVLLLFTYIAHEVLWEKEEDLDDAIFNFVSVHITDPSLTRFMKVVTYFASRKFLQVAYSAIILLFLILKNYKRAIEIAAIGIGGFLINYIMKLIFQRTRPPNPLIEPLQNFSFPSGHATAGFIFYGLLVYLIWKTKIHKIYKYIIGSILILFSILIGFSRIYLRLHYASDVIAGFCIGFAWLALAIWLMEMLKKKSDAEIRHNSERIHQ